MENIFIERLVIREILSSNHNLNNETINYLKNKQEKIELVVSNFSNKSIIKSSSKFPNLPLGLIHKLRKETKLSYATICKYLNKEKLTTYAKSKIDLAINNLGYNQYIAN